MQHQPADSHIAVPQTVEQFGNVIQDDLLPKKAFLQRLLHLRPQALYVGCIPSGLHQHGGDSVKVMYSSQLADIGIRHHLYRHHPKQRLIYLLPLCYEVCDVHCIFTSP